MLSIHVVGLGLEDVIVLSPDAQRSIDQARLLIGSSRHLRPFANHPAEQWTLDNFNDVLQQLVQLQEADLEKTHLTERPIVVLASGDPLFFGIGRLLLAHFSPEQLTFHPHLSSVQLAFSRIKQPWHDAQLVSVHGRSFDALIQAIHQGSEKIAILTDPNHHPGTIAQLLQSLSFPNPYEFWVCENLGASDERVQQWSLESAIEQAFSPLNVVVLVRSSPAASQTISPNHFPLLGIPDQDFLSFTDRPGLMTKREVRILILGELALQPHLTIWDIGAGTGSVAVEMARLSPTSQIYAIEKSSAGITLIQQNSQRFRVTNITPIAGKAPDALEDLPTPDRIFIGGSGGELSGILEACATRLASQGRIVLALATLEHFNHCLNWLDRHAAEGDSWQPQVLQVNLARSLPVAGLTRLNPLNPVNLLTLQRTTRPSRPKPINP